MSAEVTDPLAVILGGSSMLITTLLGIVIKLVSSRAKAAEEEQKAQGLTINTLWRGMTDIATRLSSAESQIKSTLTRELFEERTNNQDHKLAKIEDKLETLDRELSDRPSRNDLQPYDPGPTRPRLPSRRR